MAIESAIGFLLLRFLNTPSECCIKSMTSDTCSSRVPMYWDLRWLMVGTRGSTIVLAGGRRPVDCSRNLNSRLRTDRGKPSPQAQDGTLKRAEFYNPKFGSARLTMRAWIRPAGTPHSWA